MDSEGRLNSTIRQWIEVMGGGREGRAKGEGRKKSGTSASSC